MEHRRFGLLISVLAFLAVPLATSPDLVASGGVGIYGIVEKVVFEPNEQTPQRLQVWGSFAYVDGGADSSGAVSAARRGYMYFAMPLDARLAETVKKEWADLKRVAGTGEAVGFGAWRYMGSFDGLDPQVAPKGRVMPPELRVRPVTEMPASPLVYSTNVGVVKIPAQGSRADIVRKLQQEIRTP